MKREYPLIDQVSKITIPAKGSPFQNQIIGILQKSASKAEVKIKEERRK